jgi:hypothetical protein
MDEQIITETKTKSSGILRRIFWWVWVILLLGLLLFCLIFAAPWKVIALIAIFLAGATILPRVYRKWFWLGVGIVVLAIIAWIFLPDDNKDWQPYTFDKELAQLQAKYTVPDSQNAAIIYNQIFENWKQKEPNEPNLPDCWFDLTRKGPWLSKDQPEIALYLNYHQDTIKQLIQAGKYERCSFPIIENYFEISEQLERSSATRKWSYLLIASANNDLAEHQTKEAIEKYLAVFRMGQHLSKQPSEIEMLVSIAIEALGFSSVNNFIVLEDANELYLSRLEQAVSEIKHDFSSDLTGFIETDKLMVKNMCGVMLYQINSTGKIRFSHDPLAGIREQTKEQSADVNVVDADIFSGFWFKKLFKAYALLYWFYTPQSPENLGKIIDAGYDKHYLMIKPDLDWSKEKQNEPTDYTFRFKLNLGYLAKELARINRGSYASLHYYYLRHSANQKGTLLIIALRRYKNTNGQWPEKLDDINDIAPAEVFIDPINGDSFVYKRTEENFTLYSKGKNGIDEDGKYDYNWPAKPGADDWFIWPYKNKVSQRQEQKAND